MNKNLSQNYFMLIYYNIGYNAHNHEIYFAQNFTSNWKIKREVIVYSEFNLIYYEIF